MKITLSRRHGVRPVSYESIDLLASISIDLDNEADARDFGDLTEEEIGADLSERLDALLDTDVDRTLRLDGEHIEDTHLWVFYGRD